MADENCYLCDSSEAVIDNQAFLRFVNCPSCGRYKTLEMLVDQIKKQANRHLVSGMVWQFSQDYARNHEIENGLSDDGWLRIDTVEELESLIAQAPQSPREKAKCLLRDAIQKTPEFDERVNYMKGHEPTCYAKSHGELKGFVKYLESAGLVSNTSFSNASSSFIVTASGFDYENSATQPLTIFLSSTVYDLSDLRAELAEHLESAGHIVKMSEDFERFEVDQKTNSIQQCLNNIDASEVVLCLLDQRYGGIVKENGNKNWNGKSPTQIEFEYAHNKGVPVYAFVRDKAELDAGLLRNDINAKTQWVEARGKIETKEKWLSFYQELTKLKRDPQKPNWFDPFQTSVDLKKLVDKRLADFVKTR